nr:exopolysaccharide biosynthesis protein [uncultured Devosia sp.]
MSETWSAERHKTGDTGVLTELVDDLKQRVEAGERISIGLIQRIAGGRAAGPILLLPALVVVSPLSAIPGVPTIVGLNTILVAGQVALGRDHLWLPNWLTKRAVPSKYGARLLKYLGRFSQVADGIAKPRAKAVIAPLTRRVGAGICVAVACLMPAMEIIPFTSTWAAGIIALYALAITARDGFLTLAWLALVVAVVSVALLVFA